MFQAIHDGRPDQSLLAYQYLQMMPEIAKGDANKVWIVPSEIGKALEGLGSTMNSLRGIPDEVDGPAKRVDMGPPGLDIAAIEREQKRALAETHEEVAAAIAAAEQSSRPGGLRGETAPPASPGAIDRTTAQGDPGEPPAQ